MGHTEIIWKMKINLFFAASAFANDGSGIEDNQWYEKGEIVDADSPLSTGLVAKSGGRMKFEDNDERAVKRYSDLMGMAKKLWAKNGLTGKNKFDHRNYWGYGCHCFHLGDRPMTDDKPMPFGMPKDELDSQCRVYKQCQKCARMYHGDDCIGEFKQYRWRWANKRNRFESKNPPVPVSGPFLSVIDNLSTTFSKTEMSGTKNIISSTQQKQESPVSMQLLRTALMPPASEFPFIDAAEVVRTLSLFITITRKLAVLMGSRLSEKDRKNLSVHPGKGLHPLLPQWKPPTLPMNLQRLHKKATFKNLDFLFF